MGHLRATVARHALLWSHAQNAWSVSTTGVTAKQKTTQASGNRKMDEVVRSRKMCWPCFQRGRGVVEPYEVIDGTPMCYQCIYEREQGAPKPATQRPHPPAAPPRRKHRRSPALPPLHAGGCPLRLLAPPPPAPAVGVTARKWQRINEMCRQWWRKHEKEEQRGHN